MRILFLSTWYPYPPDNGAKLRVYHLLRALGSGHRVTLVSFAFDTVQPTSAEALAAFCQDIRVVPVNPFAANRAGALRTFLSARPVVSRPIPTMGRLIADIWRPGAFDVVIASTELMADYATRPMRGVTRILEEHNSMTRWMRERYTEQTSLPQRLRCWASWKKTRSYEAALFNRFDLVTMVSAQDQSVSRALPGYHGRVEVIPNGVDCRHNRLSLVPPQPRTLVYSGALTYSANYDAMRWFLADIYPHIRTQMPNVSLTITGSTRNVDLEGLALDCSVVLSGSVPDIRLPVVGAAVCVAPIRQGGGTRLKILEAMALGTPVVSTTKGAEGLEVADGEHLLLADDPASFAACTVRLLRDDALRRKLTHNARRLVEERYDWAQIGQNFLQLVEQTVQRRAMRQSGKPEPDRGGS